MTQCEIDEMAAFGTAQPFEITLKTQKTHPGDHFCLTESVAEGYSAGSPQAVVVARRPPSQPVVGGM